MTAIIMQRTRLSYWQGEGFPQALPEADTGSGILSSLFLQQILEIEGDGVPGISSRL